MAIGARIAGEADEDQLAFLSGLRRRGIEVILDPDSTFARLAARDCLRVLELTEQVVAALLIATRQGVGLRQQIDPSVTLLGEPAKMYEDLEKRIPFIEEDRALDKELINLIKDIRKQTWSLYEDESNK